MLNEDICELSVIGVKRAKVAHLLLVATAKGEIRVSEHVSDIECTS